MKWLIGIGILLTVLLLILLIATLYFFSFAIRRKRSYTPEAGIARLERSAAPEHFKRIREGYDRYVQMPKQGVTLQSRDGLTLYADLIEQPDPKAARGTIILVHGWRSHPQIDFSASWESYLEKGLNVLAIHQRATGKSQGKYICFGTKERFDLIDWIGFANRRYGDDQKIVISGVSMGASTVMLALGEPDLPENVVGATADCGFVSAWDQFRHVLKNDYHLPPFPLMYTTDLWSRLVADFPFRACSTEVALKNARVPVLFLHGLADGFVPPEHSRRSAAACASPHELIEVEGAGHGMSYLTDFPTVSKKLDDFFEQVLA